MQWVQKLVHLFVVCADSLKLHPDSLDSYVGSVMICVHWCVYIHRSSWFVVYLWEWHPQNKSDWSKSLLCWWCTSDGNHGDWWLKMVATVNKWNLRGLITKATQLVDVCCKILHWCWNPAWNIEQIMGSRLQKPHEYYNKNQKTAGLKSPNKGKQMGTNWPWRLAKTTTTPKDMQWGIQTGRYKSNVTETIGKVALVST